jgi:spore germination cell wall hydrolase CwlJ-like protein
MTKIIAIITSMMIFLGVGILIGYTIAPQPQEPEPMRVLVIETPVVIEPTVYYELTTEERDLVERVVMAESGGEAQVGQKAIAQCILNACIKHGIRPTEAIKRLQYTSNRPNPTESVKEAVDAIFDHGEKIFDDDVLYFYAPALCNSAWHESQTYVTTIGCHRFFKEG